jgi:hypothetical protein
MSTEYSKNADSKITEEKAKNPFDLGQLRLSQDFTSSFGVKKILSTVPVRRPEKSWWAQVHPSREDYWVDLFVLDHKSENEHYLVSPDLWPELSGEPLFVPFRLALAVNRQGGVFLWPGRLPALEGKMNLWWESNLVAMERATTAWVRVTSNQSLGIYEITEASGFKDEPKWPTESLQELIDVAFKGRKIDSWDHPMLKQLRGEA